MKKKIMPAFFPSICVLLALTVTGCDAAQPTQQSTEPQPSKSTTQMPDAEGAPAGWMTDYSAALAKAKAENKPLFVKFTGSDWCGWCIRMDKEILDKRAFKTYAEANVVRVYLDFPSKKPQPEALKAQNERLQRQFGVRGFPTVVVLSPEGTEIGRMGYMRGGPQPFLDELKGIVEGA
jgi:thioredoxin-related protein